jgi:MtfA peptidase
MFERRVQKFVDMKTFEGREELEVTTEMEALVAAAAIQITFGHPSIYFARFKRIILYPDNYFSPVAGNYHKGEVHTGGVIVLSWKNLADGYLNDHDGRNLGLHEMAHALRISDYTPGKTESDFLDRDALMRYRKLAHFEMEKIANGESDLFRQYASVNEHEFFAIAVENFFERPEEFLNYNADLMRVMETLLNQPRPIMVRG